MKKIIEKNVMITLNGKKFFCKCGCNVFTKFKKNIYKCHCCGKEYIGEE